MRRIQCRVFILSLRRSLISGLNNHLERAQTLSRKTPPQTPPPAFVCQRLRGPAVAALSLFFILTLVAPVNSSKRDRHFATAETLAANASPSPTPLPAGSGLRVLVQNLDPPPPFPSTPKPATPTSDPVEEEVDEGDVIRVNSNLVTVPASVVDQQGRAMADLKLEDFQLRVDGQPKPISDLSRSESPVRIVMLFDNSSSLTQAREFEKEAAKRFFQSVLRPIDQAAIYSVSTVPVMEHGLTSDVQSLVRTIERFSKPDGATALFDAIAQAAAYLRPEQGRKVIVIVSDGADTISDLDFSSTLQRVLGSDCQIYAVQPGQTESQNLRDISAERYLREITSQTGGALYTPKGTADLDDAFAQISADLAQQYVLSYYPQDDHNDGRFRTISLRVTTRPNLRVRSRKGYYALARQRQPWTPPVNKVESVRDNSGDTQSSANLNRQTSPDISIAASNQRGVRGISPVPLKVSTEMRDGGAVKTNDGSENKGTRTATTTSEQSPAQPSSSPAPSSTSQQNQEQKTKSTAPIPGGLLNSKAVTLPKPSYPAAARASGASGTVTVQVIVDENGDVTLARVVSGHPLLHAAAAQAARKAKFSPAKLSGQPVKVNGLIAYSFALP